MSMALSARKAGSLGADCLLTWTSANRTHEARASRGRVKSLLFIAVLLPILVCGQQNIVPNPSFEDHIGCPDNQGLFWMIPPWENTVGGGDSPDFFHWCGPPLIFPPDTVPHFGVPENVPGWQYARTGNGYVGFYAADPIQFPNGREYVQVMLIMQVYGMRLLFTLVLRTICSLLLAHWEHFSLIVS